MSSITRTWLAFAAIGAGLIHFALVVGAPLPLGIVFAVVGLAEFGWGVVAFAREAVPFPRFAIAGALVPMVAWGLLLAASTVLAAPSLASALPFLPLAIATVFDLFIAVVLAVRHRRTVTTQHRAPGVGRYLLGLALGGLVVAGLTTPALAATPVGRGGEPTEAPQPAFILPGHDH